MLVKKITIGGIAFGLSEEFVIALQNSRTLLKKIGSDEEPCGFEFSVLVTNHSVVLHSLQKFLD